MAGSTKKTPTTLLVTPSKDSTGAIPVAKQAEVRTACSTISVEEEQDLLKWCRAMTKHNKDVNITNFTTSWVDSKALYALLQSFVPNIQEPKPNTNRLQLLFHIAQEELAVPIPPALCQLYIRLNPEEKLMLHYIKNFRRIVEDKKLQAKKAGGKQRSLLLSRSLGRIEVDKSFSSGASSRISFRMPDEDDTIVNKDAPKEAPKEVQNWCKKEISKWLDGGVDNFNDKERNARVIEILISKFLSRKYKSGAATENLRQVLAYAKSLGFNPGQLIDPSTGRVNATKKNTIEFVTMLYETFGPGGNKSAKGAPRQNK